jgi:hypothetical protein
MKSFWDAAVAAGTSIGVTLALMLSVSLTVLLIFGWRTESETADTELSFDTHLKFERHAERRVQEGAAPAPTATLSGAAAPYVGGNYVSARSAMRYVLDDADGRVSMYGYDVMRRRRVFAGSGRMTGRQLIIPNFYSFLDDTYGTLKLSLSEDGRTFEGRFEGMDATKQGPVTLIRLP